jgi:hypothetical protein
MADSRAAGGLGQALGAYGGRLDSQPVYRIGDHVLLRSIFRRRVRWAWPHHFAGRHDSGRLAIYVQPGTRGKRMAPRGDGHDIAGWVRGDPPSDHIWHSAHVLRFMRPGDAHTVEIYWDTDWRLSGWYVNLQAPLQIHDDRFDTTDHALDIVVSPSGATQWKDEHDLAAVVELGGFDEELAEAIHSEGERVLAEQPWPTGWEEWRPPPEWGPLDLPEDWDVV